MAATNIIAENVFLSLLGIYIILIMRYRWRLLTSRWFIKKYLKWVDIRDGIFRWYRSQGRLRLSFKALILVCFFSGAAYAYYRLDPDKRFHRLIDGCEELVQEDRLDQAVIDMQNALKIRPDYVQGHFFLSSIYALRSERGREEAALKRVIDLDPAHEEAAIRLGRIYMARTDTDALQELAILVAERQPVRSHILNAKRFITKGNPRSALDILENASKISPESAEVRLLTAHIHVAIGETEKAMIDFQEAVRLDYGLWEAHFGMARLHLAKGDLASAVSELHITRSINPDFHLPGLFLARIHSQKDEHTEARRVLDDLLKRNPENAEARYLLGYTHMELGNFQEAINSFLRLPDEYQNRPDISYGLALAYTRTGKPATAYKQLSQLHRKGKLTEGGLKLLEKTGRVLGLSNVSRQVPTADIAKPSKHDEAEATAKKLEMRESYERLENFVRKKDYAELIVEAKNEIAKNEVKAPFYNLLAVGYLGSGKKNLAKRHFLLSYEEDRKVPSPLLNAVNIMVQEGAVDEAEKLLKNHNRQFPKEVLTRLTLGKIYIRTMRLDLAEEIFNEAIGINPNVANAHQQLGIVRRMKGDLAGARHAYESAVRLNPRDAISLNDLANLLSIEDAQLDAALQYALQAYDLAPKNANIADTLGWIYYKMGRFQQAYEQFGFARQLNPHLPFIPYHLGLAAHSLDRPEEAAEFLKLAMNMPESFPEIEQAKSVLAEIENQLKNGSY